MPTFSQKAKAKSQSFFSNRSSRSASSGNGTNSRPSSSRTSSSTKDNNTRSFSSTIDPIRRPSFLMSVAHSNLAGPAPPQTQIAAVDITRRVESDAVEQAQSPRSPPSHMPLVFAPAPLISGRKSSSRTPSPTNQQQPANIKGIDKMRSGSYDSSSSSTTQTTQSSLSSPEDPNQPRFGAEARPGWEIF